MARFEYAALTATGEQVKDVVTGTTPAGVTDSLVLQGLTVQQVRAARRGRFDIELTASRVKRPELANFSRQMAAFLSAGVPILDGLRIIETETTDKTLRRVVREVGDSLRFGDSFAGAMAAHEKAFPAFYVAVLRSAELTGELPVVLDQLAGYIERDSEARRKISAALTYPLLVVLMAAVTVGVMTVFVLPRFEQFFASLGADLPLPTRMLLAVTGVLQRWWPVLLVLLVVLVLCVTLGVRTRRGRYARDWLLLRTPALGDVVRFTVIERFCRILTAMTRAGVTIPEALRLATVGANNLVFERALVTVRGRMLQGDGLARPVADTGLFPGTVTQMMRVGEETGTLDDLLEVVAAYYSRELEHKLKRLTNLFEPLAVIVVGLIVGFVAVALVSAMYGVFNQVDVG